MSSRDNPHTYNVQHIILDWIRFRPFRIGLTVNLPSPWPRECREPWTHMATLNNKLRDLITNYFSLIYTLFDRQPLAFVSGNTK